MRRRISLILLVVLCMVGSSGAQMPAEPIIRVLPPVPRLSNDTIQNAMAIQAVQVNRSQSFIYEGLRSARDTASQALFKAIKNHDTLTSVRDTAHTAYVYKDTASLALRPSIYAGFRALATGVKRDTVPITDINGTVVHYPCDSCYAVFIQGVLKPFDDESAALDLRQYVKQDSVTVLYKSGAIRMYSDSSFIIVRMALGGQFNYFWMTVRRK